jgi:hypothetical protein
MGKRRADADTRTFFDQYESVRISRFRALGIVDPSRPQAVIPFPGGKQKLLNVSHTRFPNGGGWSYFLCPKCAKRTPRLYLVDDQPLCWRCCEAINIQHRSKLGFGRTERLKASDKALDQLIAKLEATERLKLKPHPPQWYGRNQIVVGTHRMTERMRRRMVALRLNQLANQQARARASENATLVTMQPTTEAGQLLDLSAIWKANTSETLSQALDNAQGIILAALNSDDPQQRLNAAKLMLRTKQARDRGL